ncbi:MAG: DUF4372 domain-containing protein, partial [Prevotella sp.]|nr:DUF4372 domain-containing protein [Prevotella sp.]
MYIGAYVFTQITQFLPLRQFRRIVAKYEDRTKGWAMSHWNHLLAIMFGHITGCATIRELTDITISNSKNSIFLGFCLTPIKRQM